MFNKKISLILITLVFMLSLSVVSAADSNSTDDIIAGEVDEEPPSVEDIVLSTDDSTPAQDNEADYSLNGSDVSMYYKGESSYYVTLLNGTDPVEGANVTFDLNGVSYVNTTDSTGKASLLLDLQPGTYTISAVFGNITSTNKIKVLPVITGKDVVKTYSSSKKYYATFFDSQGNRLSNTYVKFKLNGKTYSVKTNSRGVAGLKLNLKVGNYVIYAIHPNGYQISNKITVKSSIVASNLKKYYHSSKRFTATFYGPDGKPLSGKTIVFKIKGYTYTKKTNSKGVATLKIQSTPGLYKIKSINKKTGESKTNYIKVISPLSIETEKVFTGTTAKFKVTLHKTSGALAKDVKMTVYIAGSKKTVKTDSNGVATAKFKLSNKGTYTFRAVDPYTGYSLSKSVRVYLASIKAYDIGAIDDQASSYSVTLLNQDGSLAKYTYVQITLNGEVHKVKTNSKGVATINFKLHTGKYKVVCKDLKTGYQITKKITVVTDRMGMKFNQYGVSEDGLTILAIGRPSAPGDEKYSYTFYMCELERTCPGCHGHNLYWSIFYAVDEYTDQGYFPATGNKEGSSCEGAIVCADCDMDFSIFGNEHWYSNQHHMNVIYGPVKTTKEMAYLLKSGNYVRI